MTCLTCRSALKIPFKFSSAQYALPSILIVLLVLVPRAIQFCFLLPSEKMPAIYLYSISNVNSGLHLYSVLK
ncbi:hypothetical protein LOK49_LG12G02742 [Camellia lanceoleosa]|uniref:Uncharacterized protein n=1 Tax=Camellia lanceoleosa TaxID=1840588 RepID=A0ACC0FQ07_9ERIC|nr:hypothetical protein LOK49_LG12G02742 [Camellia lanceoleosa]